MSKVGQLFFSGEEGIYSYCLEPDWHIWFILGSNGFNTDMRQSCRGSEFRWEN